MNLLEYLSNPLVAAGSILLNVIIIAWWRIARNDAETWEESANSWKVDSREWERRYDEQVEANDELRKEIMATARQPERSAE